MLYYKDNKRHCDEGITVTVEKFTCWFCGRYTPFEQGVTGCFCTFFGANTTDGVYAINYPDINDAAEYAYEAAKALIANCLANGKNNRIELTHFTTRVEVAVLLKRILDYIK